MTKIIIQEYMLLFCHYTDCPLKSAATSPVGQSSSTRKAMSEPAEHGKRQRRSDDTRDDKDAAGSSNQVATASNQTSVEAVVHSPSSPPVGSSSCRVDEAVASKNKKKKSKKTKTKKNGFDLMHNPDKNTLICFMQFRPELDGCIFVFCGLIQGYIVSTLIKTQYLLEKGSQEF